jgi:tRNA pseudouridine55 synthase
VSSVHGVLVVDKAKGPTSHDVVASVRRALGVRRVGHAGTLDPMATGVLVVLVGEATKLATWLTAQAKRYVARVELGVGTDTLDADGEVVARIEPPPSLARELDGSCAPEKLAQAIAEERARREQVPPAFSAKKVEGRRSYELARRGEAAELAATPVEVLDLRVIAKGPSFVDVELVVSKGYYVRSLARDLGVRLGVPAHLSVLRRTASGRFTLDGAVRVPPGRADAEEMRAAIQPMAAAAARALPLARLTPAGALRARQGKPIGPDAFDVTPAEPTISAWLDADGALVAVGAIEADKATVLRGFNA